jgi:hypothetical protein
VLGKSIPFTPTSVDNLASALRYQGRYEQVKEMNWRTLEGTEKVLGKEHFSRLVAFSCKTGGFSYKTSRFSSKNWLRIFAVVNFVSVVQLLHVLNQLLDH